MNNRLIATVLIALLTGYFVVPRAPAQPATSAPMAAELGLEPGVSRSFVSNCCTY